MYVSISSSKRSLLWYENPNFAANAVGCLPNGIFAEIGAYRNRGNFSDFAR